LVPGGPGAGKDSVGVPEKFGEEEDCRMERAALVYIMKREDDPGFGSEDLYYRGGHRSVRQVSVEGVGFFFHDLADDRKNADDESNSFGPSCLRRRGSDDRDAGLLEFPGNVVDVGKYCHFHVDAGVAERLPAKPEYHMFGAAAAQTVDKVYHLHGGKEKSFAR
jgi:hypothetical protein